MGWKVAENDAVAREIREFLGCTKANLMRLEEGSVEFDAVMEDIAEAKQGVNILKLFNQQLDYARYVVTNYAQGIVEIELEGDVQFYKENFYV